MVKLHYIPNITTLSFGDKLSYRGNKYVLLEPYTIGAIVYLNCLQEEVYNSLVEEFKMDKKEFNLKASKKYLSRVGYSKTVTLSSRDFRKDSKGSLERFK